MGMPISIDIPGCDEPAVYERAFNRLRAIDERFSTYKPDSEVSRYIRGELNQSKLSNELKDVIVACRQASKTTDGYFSAWASGQFDPLGYVKGWAIAQAGQAIVSQGYKTFCIGAGGDIMARSAGKKIWNIGIQDPFDRTKILNKLSIANGAVATSGNYARGPHIVNPTTGQASDFWASVTVAGPDIIRADVLATACFAMGAEATNFIKTQPDYQMIAIKAD